MKDARKIICIGARFNAIDSHLKPEQLGFER
jgi:hypothetical protein